MYENKERKMMILHLFPNEKFTVDFIERINSLFPQEGQCFWVFKNQNHICSKEDLPFDNVIFGEIHEDKEKLAELYKSATRVVLHSLFLNFKSKIILVDLMKKYPKPVFWSIWGGDLYDDYNRYHGSINIRHILHELMRKQIIANLHGAIATEDYPELLRMYKTNAKQYMATYSYKFIEVIPYQKQDALVNIMVGHSATETCRHLEAFDMLKTYQGKIKVYCPLSYPNDLDYIEKVSAYGKKLFGDHFYPMTDFMAYPEYVQFLNQIDIGIFNNNRQQGNGNVTNLLYLGKKIYISPENNLLKTYKKLGAFMNTVNQIADDDFLKPYPEKIQAVNRQIVLDRYSDESFYKQWRHVFED